mgnify:CR=1 FL=1
MLAYDVEDRLTIMEALEIAISIELEIVISKELWNWKKRKLSYYYYIIC